MPENDRRGGREDYIEIWKSIPVSEAAIDIPEGATEEGAARSRVLPDDIPAEEGNWILNDAFQVDGDK